ncbi:MAG: SpoIID/LytB domain-containing protein, partial [Actinomycetota bacterium]
MDERTGARTRTGRMAALLAAVAVAATVPVAPATGHAASAEALTEERTVEGGIVVEAEDGGRIVVDRERAYRGGLLLHTDGQLVNDVAIEDYVAGIAEMPSRWPMEALKAQAVAARTYAWWHAQRSDGARTDLCATTACQVYHGVEPVEEGGERWERAVAATAGEVLIADGSPLLARYFSTSGGRTFDNAEVFPSTGEQPGLKGIDDPDDAVSPYHLWSARFERELFDELLARGERLAAAVPVDTVERRGGIDDPSARIVVTSVDGTEVVVGAGELRDLLSRVAPDARPDRYPGPAADGLRRLPSTVPTARYDIAIDDGEVVLEGRGWGHGVGMSQYGARGRAASGDSYREILAAYYDGAVPTQSQHLPERIRVDLGVAEGLTIGSDRPMTVDRSASAGG